MPKGKGVNRNERQEDTTGQTVLGYLLCTNDSKPYSHNPYAYFIKEEGMSLDGL